MEDEEFDSKDQITSAGKEFVNKVEVNYCSLCREYLRVACFSNEEKIITDHCKSKKHLKWYFKSKKKDETVEIKEEPMETSKEGASFSSINENDSASQAPDDVKEEVDNPDVPEDSNGMDQETEESQSTEKDEGSEAAKRFPR
jgi:hypothetical protein